VEESLREIIDPEADERWRRKRRRSLQPNGLEIMMNWHGTTGNTRRIPFPHYDCRTFIGNAN